jgi:hypothetical protein
VTLHWQGRAVVARDFTIAEGEEVEQIMVTNARAGWQLAIVKSLRYADDDKPVFGSVDELRACPNRMQAELLSIIDAVKDQNYPQLNKPNGADPLS